MCVPGHICQMSEISGNTDVREIAKFGLYAIIYIIVIEGKYNYYYKLVLMIYARRRIGING
jgi:hypothetical protein